MPLLSSARSEKDRGHFLAVFTAEWMIRANQFQQAEDQQAHRLIGFILPEDVQQAVQRCRQQSARSQARRIPVSLILQGGFIAGLVILQMDQVVGKVQQGFRLGVLAAGGEGSQDGMGFVPFALRQQPLLNPSSPSG